MRNKSLELEIRMKKKPDVSRKGRLYVHSDAPAGGDAWEAGASEALDMPETLDTDQGQGDA